MSATGQQPAKEAYLLSCNPFLIFSAPQISVKWLKL